MMFKWMSDFFKGESVKYLEHDFLVKRTDRQLLEYLKSGTISAGTGMNIVNIILERLIDRGEMQ